MLKIININAPSPPATRVCIILTPPKKKLNFLFKNRLSGIYYKCKCPPNLCLHNFDPPILNLIFNSKIGFQVYIIQNSREYNVDRPVKDRTVKNSWQ